MRLAPALDMKEPFYPAVQCNHCISNEMIAGAFLAAGAADTWSSTNPGGGSSPGWGQWWHVEGRRGWAHTLPSSMAESTRLCFSTLTQPWGRIGAGKSEPCLSRQNLTLTCECSHETPKFHFGQILFLIQTQQIALADEC